MALPNLPFPRLISSKQLIGGDLINGLIAMLTGTASGITALAGGGLSAATPALNSAFNEVTVTANNNDSVALPPAKSGLIIGVLNSGANTLAVFANGTDLIKVGAAAGVASVTQLTLVPNLYVCFKDGLWVRLASA